MNDHGPHPDIRELLTRHDMRCTRQREEIYRTLMATKVHPTAEELHRLVGELSPGTSLATVYNTLDVLCEAGLCRKVPTPDGTARYDADLSEHLHAVTKDGRLVDVPDDLSKQVLDYLPRGLVEEIERRIGAPISHINLETGR
ncbi:MAG TPA: transcriptional repressor [Phycisphaerales bacterium]|nr:transcriptional repressor [Phycisphaerales bacterium]